MTGDELPIDEKLLKALDELPIAEKSSTGSQARSPSLARSMDLKGTIGFEYEACREVAGGAEAQHLQVRASRCGLRYEHFPYAVYECSRRDRDDRRQLAVPQSGRLQRHEPA